MKKKKWIVASIGLVLVLIIVILFVKSFQMKEIISSIYNLKNFSYEALVELNKEQLSEKQKKILNVFCNLLGVEDELCWQLKGNVYDEIIHVELYSSDLEKEITDLYISEEQKVINIKKLYENIKKTHSFIGVFLPDWSGAEYISMEQIEYITGVDGDDLFEWNFNIEENEITIWQSIFLIFGMEKNKDGKLEFQTQVNEYTIMFEVDSKKQFQDITIDIVDNTGMKILQQGNLNINVNSSLEMNMPETVIDTESRENLRVIWSILELINDKF